MGAFESIVRQRAVQNAAPTWGDWGRMVVSSGVVGLSAVPYAASYGLSQIGDEDSAARDLEDASNWLGDRLSALNADISSFNTPGAQNLLAAEVGSEAFWNRPIQWAGAQVAQNSIPVVAGVTAGILTGGTAGLAIAGGLAGVQSAGLTYDAMVKDLDQSYADGKLHNNALFKSYVASGMSDQEALRQFKKDAIGYKPAILFGLTAAAARFSAGGQFVSKLAPSATAATVARAAEHGIARRVATAGVESGAEETFQNTLEDAMVQATSIEAGTQSGLDFSRLGQAAAAGAIVGTAMGTPAGVFKGRGAEPVAGATGGPGSSSTTSGTLPPPGGTAVVPATGPAAGEAVPSDVAAALARTTTTKAKGGRKPKGTAVAPAGAAAGTAGTTTDPVADLEAVVGTAGTAGATTGPAATTGAPKAVPTDDEKATQVVEDYQKVKGLAEQSGKTGVSFSQRSLGLSYARAVRAMEMMVKQGQAQKLPNGNYRVTPKETTDTLESETSGIKFRDITDEAKPDIKFRDITDGEEATDDNIDQQELDAALARYEQVLHDSGIVGEQFDQYMADKRVELMGSRAADAGEQAEEQEITDALDTSKRKLTSPHSTEKIVETLANKGFTAKQISDGLKRFGRNVSTGQVREIRDALGIEPAGPMGFGGIVIEGSEAPVDETGTETVDEELEAEGEVAGDVTGDTKQLRAGLETIDAIYRERQAEDPDDPELAELWQTRQDFARQIAEAEGTPVEEADPVAELEALAGSAEDDTLESDEAEEDAPVDVEAETAAYAASLPEGRGKKPAVQAFREERQEAALRQGQRTAPKDEARPPAAKPPAEKGAPLEATDMVKVETKKSRKVPPPPSPPPKPRKLLTAKQAVAWEARYREDLGKQRPKLTKKRITEMVRQRRAYLTTRDYKDPPGWFNGVPIPTIRKLSPEEEAAQASRTAPKSRSRKRVEREPRIFEDSEARKANIEAWDEHVGSNIGKMEHDISRAQEVRDALAETGTAPEQRDTQGGRTARRGRINALSAELFSRHAAVDKDNDGSDAAAKRIMGNVNGAFDRFKRRLSKAVEDINRTEQLAQKNDPKFNLGERTSKLRVGAQGWVRVARKLNEDLKGTKRPAKTIKTFLALEALLRVDPEVNHFLDQSQFDVSGAKEGDAATAAESLTEEDIEEALEEGGRDVSPAFEENRRKQLYRRPGDKRADQSMRGAAPRALHGEPVFLHRRRPTGDERDQLAEQALKEQKVRDKASIAAAKKKAAAEAERERISQLSPTQLIEEATAALPSKRQRNALRRKKLGVLEKLRAIHRQSGENEFKAALAAEIAAREKSKADAEARMAAATPEGKRAARVANAPKLRENVVERARKRQQQEREVTATEKAGSKYRDDLQKAQDAQERLREARNEYREYLETPKQTIRWNAKRIKLLAAVSKAEEAVAANPFPETPTRVVKAMAKPPPSSKAAPEPIGYSNADMLRMVVPATETNPAEVEVQGQTVNIQFPKGAVRPTAGKLAAHYGEMPGTTGVDGQPLDVYVGDKPNIKVGDETRPNDVIFVIRQHTLTPKKKQRGKFDENKVMLGFATEADAAKAYNNSFDDGFGPNRLGRIDTLSVAEFNQWKANPEYTRSGDNITFESEGQKRIESVYKRQQASIWGATNRMSRAREFQGRTFGVYRDIADPRLVTAERNRAFRDLDALEAAEVTSAELSGLSDDVVETVDEIMREKEFAETLDKAAEKEEPAGEETPAETPAEATPEAPAANKRPNVSPEEYKRRVAAGVEGGWLKSPYVKGRNFARILENTSVRSVLDQINFAAAAKGVRGRGAAMAFLKNRLNDLVGDTKIYIVSHDDLRAFQGEKAVDLVGTEMQDGAFVYYKDPNGGEDYILLADELFDHDQQRIAESVLHEVVHAATLRALDRDPKLKGRIEALINEVMRYHGIEERSTYYGFTDAAEFIAEGMTNFAFQERLAATPLSKEMAKAFGLKQGQPNAWHAFVGFIRQALKLPEGALTVLDAVAHVTHHLTTVEATRRGVTLESGVASPAAKISPRAAGRRASAAVMDYVTPGSQLRVPVALALADGTQLTRIAKRAFGKDSNPVRALGADMEGIVKSTDDYMREGEDVVNSTYAAEKKATPEQWTTFGQYVIDQTIANVHGDRPLAAQTHLGKDPVGKPSLAAAQAKSKLAKLSAVYKTLPENLKELLKKFDTFFRERQQEMARLMIANRLQFILEAEPDAALVERVLTRETTDHDKKLIGADALQKIYRSRELYMTRGPYFPLIRRGKFVVSALLKVKPPPAGSNAKLKEGTTNIYEFRGKDARERAMAYADSLEEKAWVSGRTVDEATGETWYELPDGSEEPGSRKKYTLKDPDTERMFQVEVQNRYVEFFDTMRAASRMEAELRRRPRHRQGQGADRAALQSGRQGARLPVGGDQTATLRAGAEPQVHGDEPGDAGRDAALDRRVQPADDGRHPHPQAPHGAQGRHRRLDRYLSCRARLPPFDVELSGADEARRRCQRASRPARGKCPRRGAALRGRGAASGAVQRDEEAGRERQQLRQQHLHVASAAAAPVDVVHRPAGVADVHDNEHDAALHDRRAGDRCAARRRQDLQHHEPGDEGSRHRQGDEERAEGDVGKGQESGLADRDLHRRPQGAAERSQREGADGPRPAAWHSRE